jgi:hypothetical protein
MNGVASDSGDSPRRLDMTATSHRRFAQVLTSAATSQLGSRYDPCSAAYTRAFQHFRITVEKHCIGNKAGHDNEAN